MEQYFIFSYSIINDVKKRNAIDDECDDHSSRAIRREAQLPKKRFGGFMRSPLTPPPSKCSRRVGPADAMIIVVVVE
jgi:hypothetical protein